MGENLAQCTECKTFASESQLKSGKCKYCAPALHAEVEQNLPDITPPMDEKVEHLDTPELLKSDVSSLDINFPTYRQRLTGKGWLGAVLLGFSPISWGAFGPLVLGIRVINSLEGLMLLSFGMIIGITGLICILTGRETYPS